MLRVHAVMALLLATGFVFWVLAILLAVHHGYVHRSNIPDDGKNNWCFLQWSDVCLLTRCNHETWILCFFCIGCLCFAGGLFAM